MQDFHTARRTCSSSIPFSSHAHADINTVTSRVTCDITDQSVIAGKVSGNDTTRFGAMPFQSRSTDSNPSGRTVCCNHTLRLDLSARDANAAGLTIIV